MLKRQIGSPSINLLRPDVVAAFNRIDEKIDLGARAQGTYVNSVVLPGVLLDANSTDIRGTKVAWKFDSERLKLQEVVMSAESRVTNLWAFAVTAAVVVLTAIVLVLFMRRRT
jgi:hypothetical protein